MFSDFTVIAQSYNDGPIDLQVKLREVQGNFAATDESLLGIGFAPDELTFKIWTQDNLGIFPWTGGSCLQDNNFVPTSAGANSTDFNTVFANFSFLTSTTPQYLDFKIDAWEDDLPSDQLAGFCNSGTVCTWQNVECCGIYLFGFCIGIETGDDYRCDADPFYQGLSYRSGPPCQWYSHGYLNGSCSNSNVNGYYKPHIETYWRYTKGTSFANAIDLGILTPSVISHFNSNECYTDYYSSSPGNDVIYSFYVTNPTGVNISLCGTNGAQFDSYLYLVKDTNSLAIISNDNNCANQSEINTTLCDTGVYYIVVDAISANELGTFTVLLSEDLANSFSNSSTTNPTNCYGGSDGEIQVLLNGGSAPFTFNWYDVNMSLLTSSNTLNFSDSLNNLQAGDYILQVIDDNNCVLIDTININEPSPLQLNSTPTHVSCNGFSDGQASVSVIGGTPNYSFQWNTNPIQTTASAVLLSAGIYSVIVTDAKSCADSISVAINQPPLVPVSILNNSNTVCAGGTINLLASGASSYSWSPNIWLNTNIGDSVFSTPSSSISYIVTGFDINGCSNTDTIAVNTVPSLNMTFSPNNPVVCQNQSIIINIQGASSYTWNPSAGVNQLPATPGSSFSISPQTSITYQVIGEDNFGCRDSVDIQISVLNKPSVNVTQNPSICEGGTVALVANGANTYSWFPNNGLNNTIGSIVTSFPTNSTIYNVIGTSLNGCSDTAITTVSVNPNPILSIFPSNTNLCQGDTVQAIVSGATNYIWSPALGLSSSNSDSVGVFPVTNTNYSILGIDSLGCSSTIPFNVSVNLSPNILVTSSNNTICLGDAAILTANGGVAYSWQPSSSLNINTGNTVSAIPNSTTTYTVTGIDANNCSESTNITLTVNPLPIISVNTNTSTICEGQDVQLIASGGASYIWSPALGLNTTIGGSVLASPNQTTNYFITGTDSNGCSDVISSNVIVNPLPILTVIPNSISICEGSSIPLNVYGALSYIWSPNTGLNINTGNMVIASPQSSINYTVSGVDSNNCINTSSVEINVGVLPDLQTYPSNPQICEGESITLSIDGADQYSWTPSNTLSASTGSIVTANPLINTTYTIIGTDSINCVDSINFTVNVVPRPTAIIANTNTETICSGDSALIVVDLTGNPPWNITYSINGSVHQDITNNNPYLIFSDISGNYTIPIISDANNCDNSGSGSVIINILNTPIGSFLTNPEVTDILQPQVSFTDYSIYATNWTWNFGDNSFSIDQNPIHYYEAPGSYIVTLVAANDICIDSVIANVIINPIFTFYVPDVFTPNGDGLNDIFMAKGLESGIESFSMHIYNRWGQKVFHSNDMNLGWDGSSAKQKNQSGYYSYIIFIKDALDINHEIKGKVLLE